MVKYIRLCERICVIKILVKITLIMVALIMVAFLQIHIIINNCKKIKIKIKIKKIKKLLEIWANLSVK